MTLGIDYKIKTEADGHATITFFEGSTIELDGKTEISLAELSMDGTASNIIIEQGLGKTLSRVKKLIDPASGYDVETPTAIASVRGTTLQVSVASNGTTVVGNLEGRVSVIAQGVEVELPEGTTATVLPGEPPRGPVLMSTVTQKGALPSSTSTTDIVKIGIDKTCDRQTAFPGDNLTYTYAVSNAGDVPLSSITVTDNKAGQVTYVSGDDDADGSLDEGETWVFGAVYPVKDDEIGLLTNTAVASGTAPDRQPATASASAMVKIIDIIVEITSLTPDQVVGRNTIVSGTVNDPSITRAVLTLNGSPRDVNVVKGQFSESVELADGVNVITVTVSKYPDITRSASVRLEPETPSR